MSYIGLRAPKGGLALDWKAPINKGLVGWWPLIDGAGTRACNLRFPRQPALLVNSVTWTAEGAAIASGGFLESPASTVVTYAGGFGVSFWVKGVYASQVTYANFLSKAASGTEWSLFRDVSSGMLSLYVGAVGNQVTFAGNLFQDIMNGQMNHVVYAHSGGVASIFVNGVLKDSKSIAQPAYNGKPFRIGTDDATYGYVTGTYRNVRMFTRGPTSREVLNLYRRPWIGAVGSAVGVARKRSAFWWIGAGGGVVTRSPFIFRH